VYLLELLVDTPTELDNLKGNNTMNDKTYNPGAEPAPQPPVVQPEPTPEPEQPVLPPQKQPGYTGK
jgi:hypothetical protein